MDKLSIPVDSENDYGNLLFLGELDGMKVITASNFNQRPTRKPEVIYLKFLFNELLQAFNPYSKYFILYYVYLLEGVRRLYTLNDLMKLLYDEEKANEKSSSTKNILIDKYSENKVIDSDKEEMKFLKNDINNSHLIDILKEISPPESNNKDNDLLSSSNNNENNNENNNSIKNFHDNTVLANTGIFLENQPPDIYDKLSQALDLNFLPSFNYKNGEFTWDYNNMNKEENPLSVQGEDQEENIEKETESIEGEYNQNTLFAKFIPNENLHTANNLRNTSFNVNSTKTLIQKSLLQNNISEDNSIKHKDIIEELDLLLRNLDLINENES